jgi:acetyl-CoA carboxylase carboxyl transferase subunit alpha
MLSHKLIDGIIPEPLGGAHNNREEMYSTLRGEITMHLKKLMPMDSDKRIDFRIRKFSNMGVVTS